jgi:ribosomal protein S12 methylthiotransferase accessory factor
MPGGEVRTDPGTGTSPPVVPGFRHLWARFVPGRPFGTPVELHRMSRPTPYGEVGPIPLFV